MPIRIKCPSCQKGLAIKDHLAGKRVSCPVCKKVMQVPVPIAPPADVEDFAAAALKDQPDEAASAAGQAPAASAPPPAKTIDMTCPFCDAELHFPLELAGKREPCAECSRIIQVPKPVEDKPKDWRTAQKKGPSGALANQPEQLEGAWGTATHKGRVSTQSLIDADVIEVEREYIGLVGWFKRGFWTVLVIGLLVLIVTSVHNRSVERRQLDALALALASVEPTSKLPPAWTAEVYRAAGEFHVMGKQPTKAVEYFRKARDLVARSGSKETSALDADALLIEMANNLVPLGGSPDEVFENHKKEWKDVEKELHRTLVVIRAPEARAVALRHIGSKLLDQGEDRLAIGLAAKLSVAEGTRGAGAGALAVAQEIALLLARNESKLAATRAKPPQAAKVILDPIARLGYAEGLARQGSLKEAAELAIAKGPPLHRLQASVGVGWLALGQSAGKSAPEFPMLVNGGFDSLAELKNKAPPWLVLQLLQLACQVENADRCKKLVELPIRDKDFKARAQLVLMQAQLAKHNGPAEASLVEGILDKNSLARALAWEALARHNTRLGYRDDMLRYLEDTEEKFHPFIHAGIALGERDTQE